jgi:chlorobactene glucosyltransferase
MIQEIFSVMVQFYYPILLAVGVYFFIISLANHYEMWRFTLDAEMSNGPLVSVLVPARNEETCITRCIQSLCRQYYQNYEILVLDDNSTDNTLSILERLAAENSRIKVFKGASLPQDWYGKPFALHQLSKEAKGEILLFTDADTIHNPTSISWAVTNLTGLKADMISGYIREEMNGLGEIITVPLMFLLTGFVIPLFLNRFTKFHFFSSAIGQYIAIRHEVFKAIGGCEAFKKKTSEDIYMSRHVKRMGYQTRFLDITAHAWCKMYDGYGKALEGIGKNIFDFLAKNSLLLLFVALLAFFFLFFPFPLLIINIVTQSPNLGTTVLINILYTLTWIFMFLGHRLEWYYGFLWPLLYLNFLRVASYSWFRTISGRGFLWKDRVVS